jgi:hypothetical protein
MNPDVTPTGRAWDRYTPIQKVGASLLFVLVMAVIGGLMYLKWQMKFAPSDGQKAAREYAELVPQARDMARTVRDVDTAKAVGPKLKPMLERIHALDDQIHKFRDDPAARDDIDRDLGDAKTTARDLERDLARIREKPEVWNALNGQ